MQIPKPWCQQIEKRIKALAPASFEDINAIVYEVVFEFGFHVTTQGLLINTPEGNLIMRNWGFAIGIDKDMVNAERRMLDVLAGVK